MPLMKQLGNSEINGIGDMHIVTLYTVIPANDSRDGGERVTQETKTEAGIQMFQ